MEDYEPQAQWFTVITWAGIRDWYADDAAHAIEQHLDAHPDEPVMVVYINR